MVDVKGHWRRQARGPQHASPASGPMRSSADRRVSMEVPNNDGHRSDDGCSEVSSLADGLVGSEVGKPSSRRLSGFPLRLVVVPAVRIWMLNA